MCGYCKIVLEEGGDMRKCRNQLHLSKNKYRMLSICMELKSKISCILMVFDLFGF